MQLHEIHMHAKYKVAIFNSEKVMANVKALFGRTDRLTDILTDSSTAICHPTGAIKKLTENLLLASVTLTIVTSYLIKR